jgi:DNA modification methylase
LPNEYIDLIYCDILYNTGKKFKDYNDNLGTTEEAIKWYKPRLIEMKRVLKETGSVYLQCDYRLVHYLKVEMDKIFGMDNFRNDIVWCYSTQGSSKNNFAKKYDNILYYAKNYKKVTWNPQKQKNYSPNMAGRNDSLKYNGRWDKEPCIMCGNKHNWVTDVNMRNYWLDIYPVRERNNSQFADYDTQKPKALLERIIKASSNKDDVVADFFMGSGTTGVVALELGRKFIGCDIGDKACEISKNRLGKVI